MEKAILTFSAGKYIINKSIFRLGGLAPPEHMFLFSLPTKAMLDIKFIKENQDLLQEVCRNKGISLDIKKLVSLDGRRREIITESEQIRAQQKKMGKDQIAEAKVLKEKILSLENELKPIEIEFSKMLLEVPNIYSPDTPIGKDENDNREIGNWGKPKKFDFTPQDHIALGKSLDILDTEIGTKVSGFRGYFLKNEGAILHLALMMYALEKLRKKGYHPMIPPTILKDFALFGSGHFPAGRDNIYQIASPPSLAENAEEKEAKYLAGTSESPLLAYFAGNAIEEKELPIRLAGYSQCYRSEIGSYGKDTKGLYRLHEFLKVEQVVLCRADLGEAGKLFEETKNNACSLLQDLDLPYRIMQVCSGDMGAGKYKMCDIETWMPSREAFGETHSNSLLTDWQARRLNIKYRDKGGEKKLVYTLNNTMVASPRILIALIENHQQKDGSVKIPKVLQKYTGFDKIKPKK